MIKDRNYMVVRSRNKKILGTAKKINISNVDKSGRFTNKKKSGMIEKNIKKFS